MRRLTGLTLLLVLAGCPLTPRALVLKGRLTEACLASQEEDRRRTDEDDEALRHAINDAADVRHRVHALSADELKILVGSDLLAATREALLEVHVEVKALPPQATSVDVTGPWLRDDPLKVTLGPEEPRPWRLEAALPAVVVPSPVVRVSESIVIKANEPGSGGWEDARGAIKLLTLSIVDIGAFSGPAKLTVEEARTMQAKLRAEARKREDEADQVRNAALAREQQRADTFAAILRLIATPACTKGSTPAAMQAGATCRWYVLDERPVRAPEQLELVAPARFTLESPPHRCAWLTVPSVMLPKAADRDAALEAWSGGVPKRLP